MGFGNLTQRLVFCTHHNEIQQRNLRRLCFCGVTLSKYGMTFSWWLQAGVHQAMKERIAHLLGL